MSVKILDGKLLARDLKNALKNEVEVLKKEIGFVPRLVNVMVGDNHGACAYAKSQKKAAEYIGIQYELETLPEDVSRQDFSECIKRLNADESVNGIMIHKPIPKHIEYGDIAQYVDTDKDLEGINVTNIGKMLVGETKIIPCTPASVMEHIKSTGIDLYGKEAVIVGHSVIVGKPLSLLLLEQFCCYSPIERIFQKLIYLQLDIFIPAFFKKTFRVFVDYRSNLKIAADTEFDVFRIPQQKTTASGMLVDGIT